MSCKVSVAMCTYNGSRFIREQINSILSQTHQPDEIVICDDVSSDDTVKIMKSILNKTDIGWSVVINESRLGVSKNFEKAIRICKGDFIFTSDQDDYWVEHKIEKILKEFQKNSDINLVFSNAELVDSNLEKISDDLWTTVNFSLKKLKNTKYKIFELLLKGNFVTGATMAFRKEIVQKVTPIPSSWMHDYWIAINSILNGRIIGIPDKLILYRQHDKNVIGAKKLSFVDKVKIYFKNFENINEKYILKLIMLDDLISYLKKQNNKEFNTNIIPEITNRYKFWERRAKVVTISKKDGVKEIVYDFKNNNYRKYYTGLRGALRDTFLLLRGSKGEKK